MIIDYHAHVMPEMDHGCRDTDMAMKQLKLAKEAGVNIILATPHFYPQSETVNEFLERRLSSIAKLKNVGADVRDNIRSLKNESTEQMELPIVIPAAEVLLCEHMEKMEDISKLCAGSTDLLMLEMPFHDWTEDILCSLDALENRTDLKILLVHIERYTKAQQKIIMDRGYSVQVNASFVKSLCKRKTIRSYAKIGLIEALGSDIHKADNGYKDFNNAKKYLEKLGVSI